MAKDKYDFIQDLLTNKRLTTSQKERVLTLTKSEIEKDRTLGKDLEERVKVIEDNLKQVELQTINDRKEEKKITKKEKYKGQHEPVMVYEILTSFKFNDSKYAFKYLVHGYEIIDPEDFTKRINQARSDFMTLKNIPNNLYNALNALINAYEIYGREIVNNFQVHPFDHVEAITINDIDKQKLGPIFGGGFPYVNDYFNTFGTAIQNFKKKYRFEKESSEASLLKDFLKNIAKYEKHSNEVDNVVYSFSHENANALFNIHQLKFDLGVHSFFAWNSSLKKFLKWIINSILKHSNIKGNRDFSPTEKKIIFSTYEDFDQVSNRLNITLDILDTNSFLSKESPEFIKNVKDQIIESSMLSICDFEVYFLSEMGKGSYCAILPGGEINSMPEWKEGLLYRFKFIKNI